MPKSKFAIEKLDLTGYTRNVEKVRTMIFIDNREEYGDNPQPLWIECGDIQMSKRDREPIWTIGARMSYGITDFEHDAAYAFVFEAIGVEFESAYFGDFRFSGWIAFHDYSQFRIPEAAYDPNKDPEGSRCTEKSCKAEAKKKGEKPHLILGERFSPKANLELFKKLRGRRFIIQFGSYEPVPAE